MTFFSPCLCQYFLGLASFEATILEGLFLSLVFLLGGRHPSLKTALLLQRQFLFAAFRQSWLACPAASEIWLFCEIRWWIPPFCLSMVFFFSLSCLAELVFLSASAKFIPWLFTDLAYHSLFLLSCETDYFGLSSSGHISVHIPHKCWHCAWMWENTWHRSLWHCCLKLLPPNLRNQLFLLFHFFLKS